MTREEAKSCIGTIELLRRLAFNVHGVMDIIDAGNCDKIIALLSQEPCEDWHDVPSDEMTLEQARQAVKDLRRKLAEYLDQEPCGDCISRVDAMRAITDEWVHTYGNHTLEGFTDALYNLPPVIPEQPVMTGEWVTTRTQAESEGENE